MSGALVDTSVWVEFFAGNPTPGLEGALAQRVVVLSPVVVAELISGARRSKDRSAIEDMVREIPLHETPLLHWLSVGELRRDLRSRGLSVSTPDAHIAQCALDRDAVLLTRDSIFERIAEHCALRLDRG